MGGARTHEQLVAWQLATELKVQVLEFTSRPKVAKDTDFCRQTRRSSRSTPANIAEGFRRFRPRDFARFLAIAKASLGETQNHLREGLQANHLTVEEFNALWSLSWRAMIAISRCTRISETATIRASDAAHRRAKPRVQNLSCRTYRAEPVVRNLVRAELRRAEPRRAELVVRNHSCGTVVRAEPTVRNLVRAEPIVQTTGLILRSHACNAWSTA